MTFEIKQRIKQIKNGIVPEWYKKTQVGIVPIGWEELRFKKLFSRLRRKNTEGNTNVLTISAQYGLINQEHFFNKSVASEDKSNYFLLKNGEYAYNKSYSNGYPYGAIKSLDMYAEGIVSPLYICFAKTEKNKCPDFYTQYFEAGMMNHEIKAFAQEGVRNHGLLNISVDDFFNSHILYPPLPEQEKIAKILQTQDKVIELKEKLLEEKKRQKKYLMQQLLTGKKRLPGFSGEWKKYKIKQFVTIVNNSIDPQIHLEERYVVFSLPAYDNNKTPEYLYGAEMKSNKFVVEKGMVLFNKLNVKQKRIWYISKEYDFQMLSSTEFLPLEIKNIDKEYLMYYLSSDNVTEGFIRKSSGTSNSQQRISISDLLNLEINIPGYNEQKSITIILSLADKEIKLLQKDIDQEKQKKKALMQLLLTGIVRCK